MSASSLHIACNDQAGYRVYLSAAPKRPVRTTSVERAAEKALGCPSATRLPGSPHEADKDHAEHNHRDGATL